MRCLILSFRPSIMHCSECSYVKAAPPLTSLFIFYRVLSNKYNVTYVSWIDQYTISFDCLPRSMRATSKDWSGASNPPIVDGLVKLFTPRTLRLLRNVDELGREVLDSSPSHGSRLQCTAGPCNTGGPWTTSIFSTPSGYFVLKICTYIYHRKINKPRFFGIFICLHTQVNAVYVLKLTERGNRCIWRFNILIWPIII